MTNTTVKMSDFDLATAKLSQAKSIIQMMYGDAQSLEVFDNLNDEIKANVFWACESLIGESLDLLTDNIKGGEK